MHLYFTEGVFEFYDKNVKRMIKTKNTIPFIINQDGKLIDEVNDYLLYKTEYDWNPQSNSPRTNAEHLLHFLDFCLYTIDVDWINISSTEINQYILYMTNNGNSENTIKCRIIAISSLFKWLFDKSYINQNPFNSFSNKIVKRNIKTFINNGGTKSFNVSSVKSKIIKDAYEEEIPTVIEMKDFYNCLSYEDKLMALVLIETGIRKEELIQLTTGMLHSMRESHTGKSYQMFLDASKIRIKYNRSRNIVISKELRTQLVKHILSKEYQKRLNKYKAHHTNKDDLIFISLRGNEYSPDKLNKAFDKACKESGYFKKHQKSITPHTLRHFFASNFIRRKEQDGTDMESAYMYLSQRLGHSTPDVTKAFYVKIINKAKQLEDLERYSEDFISDFLGAAHEA
jgi:integrase